MLDSEGFVAAGWVHDLGLHGFQTDSLSSIILLISATPLLSWVVVKK